MAHNEHRYSSIASDIFSGAGIGLLLGFIVGLSVSPVVQTVVGALASILAVFLGLESRSQNEKPSLLKVGLNHMRIGSFGFATIAGILIGLFLRINNPIAVPLEDHVKRWNDAFPENPVLAAQMAIYDWNKFEPSSVAYDPNKPAVEVSRDNSAKDSSGAVLFSSLSKYNVCQQLRPSRYLDDPAKVLLGYRAPGAPEMLSLAADRIAQMPAELQLETLTMTHELLCNLQREERK